MNLSIIIPVFNEESTIEEIISRVERAQPEGIELKEIIIVDDGSTDGTRDLLNQYKEKSEITLFFQSNNMGKGAAVRKGFELVSGDLWLVQDSDLEYNPDDYSKLLAPNLIRQCRCGLRFSFCWWGGTQGTTLLAFLG
jgi:glycosyltransferase involved in cell wall biosynthesis